MDFAVVLEELSVALLFAAGAAEFAGELAWLLAAGDEQESEPKNENDKIAAVARKLIDLIVFEKKC
ncbi:MAG: hypothetical protein IPJ30_26315 [Acidobacteria bacterium]|nr:hypothetical protein [Acidobacteriota bacterium]MBK8149274.1 hypothetical protein [Acidobacteriota bacterium]